MRKSFSAIITLAVAATIAAASGNSASAESSTPDVQWLVGTWTCNVKIPATADYAAKTDHGPMTVTAAPDMTIHFHVGAADYNADSYQGYDKKAKTYWNVSSDIAGTATFESSKDGTVYTGMYYAVGKSIPTRDTFTNSGHTQLRDVSEMMMAGTWKIVSDAVCTRP